MAFPSTIAALTDPQTTDKLNSPSHSGLHQSENTEIEAIETFIGTTVSSAVGTILYDVRSPDSGGGGHVQSANKGGTGQTSYAKGDMLVAQSASVLSKISVGGDSNVLIADSTQSSGVRWGQVLGVNVQSFLSGGTWAKPGLATNASRVLVELWGGGGSGASRTTSGGEGAGGGGGGVYVGTWFSASVLSSIESVAIGSGGASVVGNTNGNVGGNTVFGSASSLLTAYGGGGGQSSVGAAITGGGGGGLFGAGVSGNSGGAAGSPGSVWAGIGGIAVNGGIGVYSGGGGGAKNSAGDDGKVGGNTIYGGAGGGGAYGNQGAGGGGTSRSGGNGGAGGQSVLGTVGAVPGGGGGGATGAASGAGGAGKAIITTII